MRLKRKPILGWGINDVDYEVQKYIKIGDKKKLIWICPYYKDWKSMISRCFDMKFKENNPTYINCTITEEWKYLSNFIKWVDQQPNQGWEKCSPDKDFLIEGNKHYSPETVVYIRTKLNRFISNRGADRGKLMLGVTLNYIGAKTPFIAQCCNPFNFTRKSNHIGVFSTELEAHKAWQAKKHEYACQLADMQDDPRVAESLRQRYTPDKDWTKV